MASGQFVRAACRREHRRSHRWCRALQQPCPHCGAGQRLAALGSSLATRRRARPAGFQPADQPVHRHNGQRGRRDRDDAQRTAGVCAPAPVTGRSLMRPSRARSPPPLPLSSPGAQPARRPGMAAPVRWPRSSCPSAHPDNFAQDLRPCISRGRVREHRSDGARRRAGRVSTEANLGGRAPVRERAAWLLARPTSADHPGGQPQPVAPSGRRGAALAAIRTGHTLAWFSIESCMLYVLYAGWRGRHGRWVGVAAAVVAGESLIFAANGFRCPLTDIAERLGADQGSVTDIYLPRWLAANLPAIHAPLLAMALFLHRRSVAAWVRKTGCASGRSGRLWTRTSR
jgi:hypothetical protein